MERPDRAINNCQGYCQVDQYSFKKHLSLRKHLTVGGSECLALPASVNPLTAMLATPWLQKRPIKVPNLKSLRPFSPSRDHVKGLLSKFIVLTEDLLADHEIDCLLACMCALSSPEILLAGAVKGLKWMFQVCIFLRKGVELSYDQLPWS